jgi:integrase
VTPVVYKAKVRGEPKWCLDRVEGGKRKRSYFDAKNQAERECNSLLDQIRQTGEIWVSMTAPERLEVASVYREAKEKGLTLRAVWEAYKSGQGGGVRTTKTLGEAVAEVLAVKKAANRRKRYLTGLKNYFALFVEGRKMLPVDQITPVDIEKWFDSRKEAPSSRASNLGRLYSLFSFCYRRNYIASNPCSKVERVRVQVGRPKTFNVAESRILLETCLRADKKLLPYIVLQIFAGFRPAECEQLSWDQVDFDKARVHVHEGTSKVHRWRYVPLEPAAIEWLKTCDRKKPLIPKSLIHRRRNVVKVSGLKWVQDILRRTAASFLMAKYRDAQKVSEWLGNSPKILRTHYVDLYSPEEAAEFFNIKPKEQK